MMLIIKYKKIEKLIKEKLTNKHRFQQIYNKKICNKKIYKKQQKEKQQQNKKEID